MIGLGERRRPESFPMPYVSLLGNVTFYHIVTLFCNVLFKFVSGTRLASPLPDQMGPSHVGKPPLPSIMINYAIQTGFKYSKGF